MSEMPASTVPVISTGIPPRYFDELPGLWVMVGFMSEELLAEEAPRASGFTTFIGILIYALVSAILLLLSGLISGGSQMAQLTSELRTTEFLGIYGGITTMALCVGLVGVPLGFYVGNGLSYIGARVLGGTGGFTPQAYLVSLFYVPLGIVTSLLNLVPIVGPLVGIGVYIYMFILNVRAIKVVHQMGTWRAIAAILWPSLVLILLCCGLAALLMTLSGPAMGDVFSNLARD